MFTLGSFDAITLPGLKAALRAWPSLPGVDIETVKSPGAHGEFFAKAGLGAGVWVFDLEIRTEDPHQAIAVADQVTAGCTPIYGPRPLGVDVAPGWRWMAVTERPIEWTRGRWIPGSDCRLQSTVSFRTPDPYGYAIPDEVWDLSGGPVEVTHEGDGIWGLGGRTVSHEVDGVWQVDAETESLGVGVWSVAVPGADEATLTRLHGNTPSFPTIEIEGVVGAGQLVTLTCAGQTVTVQGPLMAGQVLRLDYMSMGFGIWDPGTETKLMSVVGRMSSFDRLALPVGESVISVTSTGTLTTVRVKANSRRI